jgi:hypothetical protein
VAFRRETAQWKTLMFKLADHRQYDGALRRDSVRKDRKRFASVIIYVIAIPLAFVWPKAA